jgi:hypothetical protein
MSELMDQHSRWSEARGRLGAYAGERKRIVIPAGVLDAPARTPRVFTGPLTSMQILWQVCEAHNLEMSVLIGSRRSARVIPARQEAAFRMYCELDLSLQDIGRRMHRDHTSVIASIRRYLVCNPEAQGTYDEARERREMRPRSLRERVLILTIRGYTQEQITKCVPVSESFVAKAVRQAKKAVSPVINTIPSRAAIFDREGLETLA